MERRRRPLEDVSSLPHYGKHFPFLPWTLGSKLRVSLVFARHLFRELGALRFAIFWLTLPFKLVPTYRKFRQGFALMAGEFGFLAEMEWLLLVIVYGDLKKKEGKERAYLFAKAAIQDTSTFMMNEFYQADLLAEFEDPYEAFWLYHKAMFRTDPNYPNELIEGKDLKVMIVNRCRNCEIADLTIPELASLGCDHDITGYQAIQDKVGMEFRRPETLAKDRKPCRFMFYRKGTAPEGDFEIH